MKDPVHQPGFGPPAGRPLGKERRVVALAELVATAALAFCTLLIAVVMSMGVARANPAGAVIDNEGDLFAISLLLGLMFIGAGGLTAIMPRRSKRTPRR